MNRSLFTRIVRDLSANCPYFQEGCDAVGKAGISALVKCTSAIRQLAYAAVPDSLDEYLQIGEKTSRDCLMHFCNGVIELYGEEYLRRPTQTDVEKLYAFHENKHGFPGMIGSIDCTKWSWAQCPQAYRAQFSRGDSGSEPFILLEAVASQDLWIWHAFFGVAGSNNDVNVLRQSPVLNDLKVGKAPEVPFVANDVTYKWGYYLTDGIYPEWAVLMKSISQPGSNDVKRIRYKQAHEAARKDVERAFGVLKKKWAIVRTPARSRSLKRITHLMYTCIILHNMIRKEKGKAISPDFYPEEQHREDDPLEHLEEQQLEHLVALLDSVILSNSNDRWVSDLNGDGVFVVKDVRELLDVFFLPRTDISYERCDENYYVAGGIWSMEYTISEGSVEINKLCNSLQSTHARKKFKLKRAR
ncbi:ALP1-like protein isoform X1 [Tanacetum coccineum]